MIKELVFESPINNLSLGNVGFNILKSLKNKGIKVHYLPVGQPDLGNFKVDNDFVQWLQSSTNSFLRGFSRNLPCIKNWHINGSWNFPTDKKYLLTYTETDAATPEEINICKNIDRVFFCGNYSESIYKDYGLTNIDTFNLGFDKDSFYKINKTYFTDNRISWLLSGKTEFRKNTLKTLSLWAKKFGKKPGESYKPGEQIHFLNCCITNPFYDIKIQENQIAQALGGIRYSNIQFFPFLGREQYNDLLNASDIDLTGLSGGESWNLIPFNISALGKWSIVLNCAGVKSWANKDNSILINPNGKVSCVDNIHFHANSPFNTGNFYTYDDNDVLNAMDLAISKVKTQNLEGIKLQDMFTYDKSVDYILSKIEEDLVK